MDLQQMDLSHLIILWQTSDGNPPMKREIEIELKKRIYINTKYSREYFFNICKVRNHAITVSFIPTSQAYENYGPSLTIDIIMTDEETQEMIMNYTTNPPINTYGIIKVKVLVEKELTEKQIKLAASQGFHTSDVFETLHV